MKRNTIGYTLPLSKPFKRVIVRYIPHSVRLIAIHEQVGDKKAILLRCQEGAWELLDDEHQDMWPHYCPKCDIGFISKETLKAHFKTHLIKENKNDNKNPLKAY